MPVYPSINDRDYDLLKKMAENTAEIAAAGGGGGGGIPDAPSDGFGYARQDGDWTTAPQFANAKSTSFFTENLAVGQGRTVIGIFLNSKAINFGTIGAGASVDSNITVVGCLPLDCVILGLTASPTVGLIFQAFVSAADTVTVRATNITAAPVSSGSATYFASVIQFAS